MIAIREAVVVEGRYDQIRLSSVLDAVIVTTEGFRIFKDKEKLALLRLLADKTGLVVLTDSDRAGFLIRHYISSAIEPSKLKHAYIPDISGRERRKSAPSKEGTLGVEGMSADILIDALVRAGVDCGSTEKKTRAHLTKAQLFEDGLTGGPGSAALRARLLSQLGLPARLTANPLLAVLNAMLTEDEYRALLEKIRQE